MRSTTLVTLAHAPLLVADDLALLRGIAERGARRALDARVAAGEAGCVTDPATRRHLYYLTADGVVAAAHLMDNTPEELLRRYGLGESALLHRLPALGRLIAGRRVLLRLASALSSMGGSLDEWRVFPVRWPFKRAGRAEAIVLDGEATLCFPDGRRVVVGYLWDGDLAAPDGTLATRLDRLAEVQACPDYAPPYRTRVPPVLLVTVAATRVPPGYRPGLLWTTVAALDVADPLTACWMGSTGCSDPNGGRDLRAALDRLGVMPPRPTPASEGRMAATVTAPATPDTLRRRVAKVHASPCAEPAHKDLLTLPLVLPPRAWPLLLCVGQHPLLNRHDLATVLEGDAFDTWDVLRVLCAHGLCQAWRPNEPERGRAWRYSLTTRGTTLLAHAQALTPLAYRRINGVLDDAGSWGERGLSYARGNLAHTDGINAAFTAFLAATRARGGTLWWRGEWACTRPYLETDQHGHEGTHTLRPDAELRYSGPGGSLRAFLEVDRDNESATQLAGKVDQYAAYRASTGNSSFAVLLVIPGVGRAHAPLARARELSHTQRMPVLDLRATTAAELAARGPWATIWRDVRGSIGALDGQS